MGCSMSAIREDQDELEDVLKQFGLRNHPEFGNIDVYSPEARLLKLLSRDVTVTTDQAIEKLVWDKHERAAKAAFTKEMAERKTLAELRTKYGS